MARILTMGAAALVVALLISAASTNAQPKAPADKPASTAASVDGKPLRDELWGVLRTLRQERAAYYQRRREQAALIDEAHRQGDKLDDEVAGLRAREKTLDRGLAGLRQELDGLREEDRANRQMADELAKEIEHWTQSALARVEAGIPCRKDERTARLIGLNDTTPTEGFRLSGRLGAIWSFAQEELRIARSGETFTAEVNLGNGRVKHARLFRVGHQVLGFLTEDGAQTGLWTKAGGWRYNLTGNEDEAVRKAIEILDRRSAPELVSLPVWWWPHNSRSSNGSSKHGNRQAREGGD